MPFPPFVAAPLEGKRQIGADSEEEDGELTAEPTTKRSRVAASTLTAADVHSLLDSACAHSSENICDSDSDGEILDVQAGDDPVVSQSLGAMVATAPVNTTNPEDEIGRPQPGSPAASVATSVADDEAAAASPISPPSPPQDSRKKRGKSTGQERRGHSSSKFTLCDGYTASRIFAALSAAQCVVAESSSSDSDRPQPCRRRRRGTRGGRRGDLRQRRGRRARSRSLESQCSRPHESTAINGVLALPRTTSNVDEELKLVPMVPAQLKGLLPEVYVGGLMNGTTSAGIEEAFKSLFLKLPDYRDRYPDPLFSPVVKANIPGSWSDVRFIFVQFHDWTLAATAVMMSGIQVGQASCRVTWGQKTRECVGGDAVDVQPLDVGPLRSAGELPFFYVPGVRMLKEVYVGGVTLGLMLDGGERLKLELSAAMLAVPLVRAEYPDLTQPVVDVKGSKAPDKNHPSAHVDNYAFVTMANEILASTLVSMQRVSLPCGHTVHIGWCAGDKNAEARAPLPLPVEAMTCFSPTPDPAAGVLARLSTPADEAAKTFAAAAKKLVVYDEDACEIHLGSTFGIEPDVLEHELVKLFHDCSDYREKYGDKVPCAAIRKASSMSCGNFTFVRMLDPVLATTAVAFGRLEVNGRRIKISRPSHWKAPEEGSPKRLQIGDQEQVDMPKPQPTRRRQGARATIWVGNLSADDVDMRSLDHHLTTLAMSAPGFDLEGGPPIRKLDLHHCKRYAFVIVDQTMADKLRSIWDGTEYKERPLAVNYSWRYAQQDGPDRNPWKVGFVRPEEEDAHSDISDITHISDISNISNISDVTAPNVDLDEL